VALRGQLLSNAFDKTKSFTPYVVFSVITDPEVGQLAANVVSVANISTRFNTFEVKTILVKVCKEQNILLYLSVRFNFFIVCCGYFCC
jgi:hypothetical protein